MSNDPATVPSAPPLREVHTLACDQCAQHGIESEAFSLILMSNGKVDVCCDHCGEALVLEDWGDVLDILAPPEVTP